MRRRVQPLARRATYLVFAAIVFFIYTTQQITVYFFQMAPQANDVLWHAAVAQKSRGSSSVGNPTIREAQEQRPQSACLYAYAWLIGSIHEDKKAYKGFIFNILIAAKILREKGSKADFVLWAQLSPQSKLKGRLPEEDTRLLRELGVEIRMLDTVEYESFAQIVYEKFRVLTMTEYKRVLFMDADIMPRTSLDYLFHLSVTDDGSSPLLRPNLMLATRGEPCNTGLFMVEPSNAGWKLLKDTIERQHEEGAKIPYPHFDKDVGWGYSFMENADPWQSVRIEKGWKWSYHASHSDQGLMYYWAKFGMKDTSIIIGDILQNFVPDEEGKHKKDFEGKFSTEIESRGLNHLMPPREPKIQYNCGNAQKADSKWFMCNNMPYMHMIHFFGSEKPWQHGFHHENKRNVWYGAAGVWFDNLKQLNEKYDMGLDIDNWDEKHHDIMQRSPFGYLATWKDQAKILEMHVGPDAFHSNQKKPLGEAKVPIVTSDKPKAPTVAYVVSFIQCSGTATNSAGLVDASLVMRHSIHQISVRNPDSGSKYDYKMYAIVHRQAETCSETLKHAGFEIILVDPPVQKKEIRGDYLRKKIQREFCCGHHEFIKLYAYNKVPEEVFVHVDIDYAFFKPMDHLYDAILYSKESEDGKRARSLIELERETDNCQMSSMLSLREIGTRLLLVDTTQGTRQGLLLVGASLRSSPRCLRLSKRVTTPKDGE